MVLDFYNENIYFFGWLGGLIKIMVQIFIPETKPLKDGSHGHFVGTMPEPPLQQLPQSKRELEDLALRIGNHMDRLRKSNAELQEFLKEGDDEDLTQAIQENEDILCKNEIERKRVEDALKKFEKNPGGMML